MRASGRASCFGKCMVKIAKRTLKNQKSLMQHLKKRGCVTTLWVQNTDKEFEEVLETFGKQKDGALDGIMTDYPSKLNEFI